MTTVSLWRVRCTTEDAWVETWAEAEPTTCPNNGAHTIDANLNSILASQALNQVNLLNEAGEIVDFPLSSGVGVLKSKKTPRMNPDIFPPGYMEWITGALDELDAGNSYASPKRGEGQLFQWEETEPGDYTVAGQFFEHILVVGGGIACEGGGLGDYINFSVEAPASAPTANGGGTGNANKVDIGGGANIIVPANNNGAWDVNGSALTVGEINENLVPVPNSTNTGFWDWNPDESPSITPNPAQKGEYDLYDFPIVLAQQANRLPLIGNPNGQFAAPSVRGKAVLPHWQIKATVHKATTNATTLKVGMYAITGRRTTKP